MTNTSTTPTDQLDIDPTEFIRKALAEHAPTGFGRYWRIRLRKSRTLPIEVMLMEFATESAAHAKATGLSTMIGFEYTTADISAIVEAAKLTIARVAGYKAVIGDFIEGAQKDAA